MTQTPINDSNSESSSNAIDGKALEMLNTGFGSVECAGIDPYRDWLKITAVDRPLSIYQLAGKSNEEGPLLSAADIQDLLEEKMATVRRFQNGKHSRTSQDLLNELARANVFIKVEENKRAYDSALAASSDAERVAEAETGSDAAPELSVAIVTNASPTGKLAPLKEQRALNGRMVGVGIAGLVAVVLLVGLLLLLTRDGDTQTGENEASEPRSTKAKDNSRSSHDDITNPVDKDARKGDKQVGVLDPSTEDPVEPKDTDPKDPDVKEPVTPVAPVQKTAEEIFREAQEAGGMTLATYLSEQLKALGIDTGKEAEAFKLFVQRYTKGVGQDGDSYQKLHEDVASLKANANDFASIGIDIKPATPVVDPPVVEKTFVTPGVFASDITAADLDDPAKRALFYANASYEMGRFFKAGVDSKTGLTYGSVTINETTGEVESVDKTTKALNEALHLQTLTYAVAGNSFATVSISKNDAVKRLETIIGTYEAFAQANQGFSGFLPASFSIGNEGVEYSRTEINTRHAGAFWVRVWFASKALADAGEAELSSRYRKQADNMAANAGLIFVDQKTFRIREQVQVGSPTIVPTNRTQQSYKGEIYLSGAGLGEATLAMLTLHGQFSQSDIEKLWSHAHKRSAKTERAEGIAVAVDRNDIYGTQVEPTVLFLPSHLDAPRVGQLFRNSTELRAAISKLNGSGAFLLNPSDQPSFVSVGLGYAATVTDPRAGAKWLLQYIRAGAMSPAGLADAITVSGKKAPRVTWLGNGRLFTGFAQGLDRNGRGVAWETEQLKRFPTPPSLKGAGFGKNAFDVLSGLLEAQVTSSSRDISSTTNPLQVPSFKVDGPQAYTGRVEEPNFEAELTGKLEQLAVKNPNVDSDAPTQPDQDKAVVEIKIPQEIESTSDMKRTHPEGLYVNKDPSNRTDGGRIWFQVAEKVDLSETSFFTADFSVSSTKGATVIFFINNSKGDRIAHVPVLLKTGRNYQPFAIDVRQPFKRYLDTAGNGPDTEVAVIGFERASSFFKVKEFVARKDLPEDVAVLDGAISNGIIVMPDELVGIPKDEMSNALRVWGRTNIDRGIGNILDKRKEGGGVSFLSNGTGSMVLGASGSSGVDIKKNHYLLVAATINGQNASLGMFVNNQNSSAADRAQPIFGSSTKEAGIRLVFQDGYGKGVIWHAFDVGPAQNPRLSGGYFSEYDGFGGQTLPFLQDGSRGKPEFTIHGIMYGSEEDLEKLKGSVVRGQIIPYKEIPVLQLRR